jgi:hypothetical protein
VGVVWKYRKTWQVTVQKTMWSGVLSSRKEMGNDGMQPKNASKSEIGLSETFYQGIPSGF